MWYSHFKLWPVAILTDSHFFLLLLNNWALCCPTRFEWYVTFSLVILNKFPHRSKYEVWRLCERHHLYFKRGLAKPHEFNFTLNSWFYYIVLQFQLSFSTSNRYCNQKLIKPLLPQNTSLSFSIFKDLFLVTVVRGWFHGQF